jgi:hypothetical protein
LYLIIGLSLLLPRVPVAGTFFRIINTMIHESAHALAALLTSGEVLRLDLKNDTSGSALTQSSSWFGRFVTAVSGYPASSASAWLLFFLIKSGHYDWILFGLFSLALINLLLWVRNPFGILWLIIFMMLTAGVFYWAPLFWHKLLAVFCAGVVLFDSVVAAYTVFILSIKKPKQSGDAANLARITSVPAVVWGLFFFAQSSVFAWLTSALFIEWKVLFN